MDKNGRRIVAILTDFGDKDPYVAEMKAVMLGINPNITFIDITHNIDKHSIRSGAFVLYTTYKYFPEGTIFLVIIDPGVGTERKPVLVETEKYTFIAPDNGVISPTVRELNIKNIVWLQNKEYFLEEISSTFHGRDIFAPVAAHVSLGVEAKKFGKTIGLEELERLELIRYRKIGERGIEAEVNYIDHFGNIITSIPNNAVKFELGKTYIIETFRGKYKARRVSAYGDGIGEELLILEGSHGFWEIAVNRRDASKILGVDIGNEIKIKPT